MTLQVKCNTFTIFNLTFAINDYILEGSSSPAEYEVECPHHVDKALFFVGKARERESQKKRDNKYYTNDDDNSAVIEDNDGFLRVV